MRISSINQPPRCTSRSIDPPSNLSVWDDIQTDLILSIKICLIFVNPIVVSMDDYDDFSHLIKRIGAFLSAKISQLLNTQDLPSVWSLGVLVAALIFTCRLLWAPSGSQRRQRKVQTPTPRNPGVNNSQPNANNLPSRNEDSTPTVINESLQHVKPTLGQIIRQRLTDGRKVTCRLLGIILEESTPEELQNQATVRSSVLEILLEMTKLCDLYLMETVLDDESEKRVLTALENAGVFTSGGLVKDKVLFCSTDIGRTSFVRQLEPDWHIDSNHEINFQLARFIKCQLHISPIETERIASNVFSSSSLEQFFGV